MHSFIDAAPPLHCLLPVRGLPPPLEIDLLSRVLHFHNFGTLQLSRDVDLALQSVLSNLENSSVLLDCKFFLPQGKAA